MVAFEEQDWCFRVYFAPLRYDIALLAGEILEPDRCSLRADNAATSVSLPEGDELDGIQPAKRMANVSDGKPQFCRDLVSLENGGNIGRAERLTSRNS